MPSCKFECQISQISIVLSILHAGIINLQLMTIIQEKRILPNTKKKRLGQTRIIMQPVKNETPHLKTTKFARPDPDLISGKIEDRFFDKLYLFILMSTLQQIEEALQCFYKKNILELKEWLQLRGRILRCDKKLINKPTKKEQGVCECTLLLLSIITMIKKYIIARGHIKQESGLEPEPLTLHKP